MVAAWQQGKLLLDVFNPATLTSFTFEVSSEALFCCFLRVVL
jgi:hypothetical protein